MSAARAPGLADPLAASAPADDGPATADHCARSQALLSNEEVAIAAEMRALRRQVQQLRQRGQGPTGEPAAADAGPAAALEQELARLRQEWQSLSGRLARATARKHMMLGHAPWDPRLLDPDA